MKKIRLQYIDGLKGLGALMVFFTHYRMMALFYPDNLFRQDPVFSFLMSGEIAVPLFIMVSGFSIALATNRRLDDGGRGLDQMLLMRYFRLALPIAFVLFVEGLLYPLGVFCPQYGQNIPVRAAEAYCNLSYIEWFKAFVFSPIGETYGWLSPTWMLKYVFLGTFIIVVLKLAVSRITSLGIKIASGALAVVLFGSLSIYYVSVLLGYILYEIWPYIVVRRGVWGLVLGGAFWGAALALHIWLPHSGVCNILVALLLLLSVLSSSSLQHIFSLSPMLWLGKISFALYLLHWPLICSLSVWLWQILPLTHPLELATCTFVMTVTVLFLLSAAFSEIVERRICGWIMRWLKGKLWPVSFALFS